MVEIILIELISIISFLYSLWLMFAYFAPMNEVFLVFIWTVGASLIFALSHRKRKIYNITMIKASKAPMHIENLTPLYHFCLRYGIL